MKKYFILFAILVGFVGCSPDKDTAKLPIVTTAEMSSISTTSAVSGGGVSAGESIVITSRGVCWSTTSMPTILNTKTTELGTTGVFASVLNELASNTKYYVRAYVTCEEGTVYGNEISFTTQALQLPVISTIEISSVEPTSAVSGGNISADESIVITARGICWSTTSGSTVLNNKTAESGTTGVFTSALTGLNPNTKYYVRAYVVYDGGTIYGNQISFTTLQGLNTVTVTDFDGNVYGVVAIGAQNWLKQNLNVSHYRIGEPIPQAHSQSEWNNATTGMWCYYANNAANGTVYGKLYNWYAVMDPRGLAPVGCHVATNAEWTDLTTYLGETSSAGGSMKALTQWASPNTGATNNSGFSALPGGALTDEGFGAMGFYGKWWTATEDPNQNALAWYRILYSDSTKSEVYHNYKQYGLSVRCVKD